VNLDSNDNVYVVDGRLGRLIRLDKDTGDQTLIATLESGIDNLAINSRDEVFVTNLADNAIHKINSRTGSYRTIMQSTLSVPGGLDVATDHNVDTVYIGDLFNYSSVNGVSGEVQKIKRGLRDHFELAMTVTVQNDKVVTSSWFADAVEIFDRHTGDSLASYHNLNDPVDAILLDDGRVLVAEQGTGNLVAIDTKNDNVREVLVSGISGMAALHPASKDEVYLSKIGTGQLLRINLKSGKQSVVTDGLLQPEGFDVAPDGTIVLAEVGKKRIIRIDPNTGAISEVARNLAIGYPAASGSPAVFITTGVGVSDSGAIYVSSDRNTAIYKITKE
jgi:sugar lactone lactonase YvrE